MSDYTVEYFAGGSWLRVTRDGKVVHEGDCRLSAWAVADVLARLGSVEIRAASGGSWVERAGFDGADGRVTYEQVPEGVRVEYEREAANTTTVGSRTRGPSSRPVPERWP